MATIIDTVISPFEQEEWLRSGPLFGTEGVRQITNQALTPYDNRLETIIRSAEWPTFAYFLRLYIEEGIVRPFDTQPTSQKIGWWNITIQDRSFKIVINIWRQYVATFNFSYVENDENIFANGEFYVDRQTVEMALGKEGRLHETISLKPVTLIGNKRELIGIFVRNTPIEIYEHLFAQDWFIQAIRVINLDLMHGGQLSLGRQKYHVPKLVDAIFAEPLDDLDPTATGREGEEIDASDGEARYAFSDPEIQEIVWRRKNSRIFSTPVLARAEYRCAISGVEAVEMLEACHIKPWAVSDTLEKFDVNNGLCLAAHIHSAFDAHLICVSPDGQLILSNRLSRGGRERLNLKEGHPVAVTPAQRPYLEYRYSRYLERQASDQSRKSNVEAL